MFLEPPVQGVNIVTSGLQGFVVVLVLPAVPGFLTNKAANLRFQLGIFNLVR